VRVARRFEDNEIEESNPRSKPPFPFTSRGSVLHIANSWEEIPFKFDVD
jgi:hypothetical protein